LIEVVRRGPHDPISRAIASDRGAVMLRNRLDSIRLAARVVLFALVATASSRAQEHFPPGFVTEQVGSFWVTPIAIAFAAPEVQLVAETRGLVWGGGPWGCSSRRR
jgi:hypothetical protein